MQTKKAAKLALLKFLIMAKIALMAAACGAGFFFMGAPAVWAFPGALVAVLIIVFLDEREARDKAILKFPMSFYLRSSRQNRRQDL